MLRSNRPAHLGNDQLLNPAFTAWLDASESQLLERAFLLIDKPILLLPLATRDDSIHSGI